MKKIQWTKSGVAALALLALLSTAALAKVFKSPDHAVKDAFPKAAEIETKNIVLTKEQVEKAETLAKAKIGERLASFYIGKDKDGKILGYAFIGSHVVRTKQEAFIVTISPEGEIKRVEIIAFHEPMEYLPVERWLELFKGKKLKDPIRAKKDIPNITGATLTARALSDAVRKTLAIFEIAFGEEGTSEESEKKDASEK